MQPNALTLYLPSLITKFEWGPLDCGLNLCWGRGGLGFGLSGEPEPITIVTARVINMHKFSHPLLSAETYTNRFDRTTATLRLSAAVFLSVPALER